MIKKRLSDGILVSLADWNLLPDSQLKNFEDVQDIELPNVIKARVEAKKERK